MSQFQITGAQVDAYHRDGYLITRQLFNAEEMKLLREIAHIDREMFAQAKSRRDASGGVTQLSVRNELADDIYSAVVRSHRMVDTMERLIGEEVYHYHHKVMLKEPRVGGAWEWHQDYGYWYDNGCLYPNMASCMVAIDRATRANGCLQVIQGSHLAGRIEHGKTGDQTGADMERVEELLKRRELLYVEMEPGDAVFFHGNTLHRSDQNRSDDSRWAMVCCYNAASNDPYKTSHHPNYSHLDRWDDSRIVEVGRRQLAALKPQEA